MKSIAALLACLVAAGPSFAQRTEQGTGSIIPQVKPATFDRDGVVMGDSARRTTDKYAACVLSRQREQVLEALALPSGSSTQNQAFTDLVKSDCLATGHLHYSEPTFRGSFYTELVRTQFGRKDVSLAPDPADYTKEPAPGGGSLPIPNVAELLNFASCVIHKDPKNARDAILTTAGSPKEDAAMSELAKVYSQCLYSDQTLRFSKGDLIGLLAEAYYREGIAATQVSAAK